MYLLLKKTFGIFSIAERKQLYGLVAAMFVLAVIEVLSVGSVMPFMAVLSNPEMVHENRWLSLVYHQFDFESQHAFLLAMGGLVLLLLLISNAAAALITWMILRYSWMSNHRLSLRLFKKYLSNPYIFYLNRNSSELTKNIIDEVQLVIVGIVIATLMIVKSSFTIVFIFFFLLFVNIFLAIIVSAVLGAAYFFLFLSSSKLLSLYGRNRAEANKRRFELAAEGFSSIKVIKLLGREAFFANRYSQQSYIVSDNFAKKAVVAQLPRYGFEIIAFGGILTIVLYYLATNRPVNEVVPVLSLYAFAGYRLMPAMQTVFNKAANVRYAIPALDILCADLNRPRSIPDSASTDVKTVPQLKSRGIRLNKVTFSYPGQHEPVLKDFHLFIPVNKTIGIAGPTGSGKTTVIDIILGLLDPMDGALMIDGTVIDAANKSAWQRRIGYVPQEIYLSDDTIRANIGFGIDEAEIETKAVTGAARLAQMQDFIERELPDGYATVVGERGVRLSGGQKQRIGIARALYHDPDVLIFDEATSALDGATEEVIMQAIHGLAHRKTIIMIAHRLSTLKDCDEIVVLEHGAVVSKGSFAELLRCNDQFDRIKHMEKIEVKTKPIQQKGHIK